MCVCSDTVLCHFPFYLNNSLSILLDLCGYILQDINLMLSLYVRQLNSCRNMFHRS